MNFAYPLLIQQKNKERYPHKHISISNKEKLTLYYQL